MAASHSGGKATAPVEFGVKFDLSLDADGYGGIEKISFDLYNEGLLCRRLWSASRSDRALSRGGLADQIYRTRGNRRYCKRNRIRLFGLRLGRAAAVASATTKNQEYQDNTERIEVERDSV